MSRAASASADSLRAQMSTFTPSRASARSVSRPIPLLPPVARAVLLARPSSMALAPFKSFLLESAKSHATATKLRPEEHCWEKSHARVRAAPPFFDRADRRSGNQQRCAPLCGPSGQGYSTSQKPEEHGKLRE